jgi:peptidoglycan/xylan/chitin deacetylase (PgdA/CDA1 family)
VGHAIGRLAIVVLLMSTGGYLLQAQDSAPPTPVPAAPAPVQVYPILTVPTGAGGREYFTSRHQVVPLGASVIRLPILMYHYIRRPPSVRSDLLGYRLSVAPDDFQAQMDWLYVNHYHPVNFDQIRAYFAGLQPLPARPVVITLDDGYKDLYTTAYPILAAHGFTAVAYIVSGFVGRSEYVSSSQVLQMDRGGIEIASHTVDHADLARTSLGMTTYQLAQSKRWLESLIGHPVTDFAYPSGKFNLQTIQVLSRVGYQTAVIEDGSSMHSLSDRYLWGRVRVGGGESLPAFIDSLGSSMPTVTLTSLDVEPT